MTDDNGGRAYLRVAMDGRPLLGGTLADLALAARFADGGELLPFTYRDPIDPEAPDEPRPLRRAVLSLQDLGTVPDPAVRPAFRACADCRTPIGCEESGEDRCP